MQWYYVRDGASIGPVSDGELERLVRRGELRPADLVWNSDLGDTWKPASEATPFFAAPRDTLPPVSRTREDPAAAPRRVSLTDPVREAWAGMTVILFRPFNMNKWLALGFAAWLATLGEGGGFGGSGGNSRSRSGGDMAGSFEESWAGLREFFHQFGPYLAGAIAIAVAVGLAVGILMMWLRARGKFILLDNVVHNRGEINEPWQRLKGPADSLFRWTLGYAAVCLVIVLGLLALAWFTVARPCVAAGGWTSAALPGAVVLGATALALGIVSFYILRFLEDFVVPLMYCHGEPATRAWRRFGALFGANAGRFLGYGLFVILLQLLALLAVVVAVLATCFVAGCLLALPYVGAVVLLPVTVFFRVYSLAYLDQFGPAYWRIET